MRVIDLLNKIANGEELPKKIKAEDKTYTLFIDEDTDYHYYQDDKCKYFMFSISCLEELNEKVEIIEEDKKIPTLKNLNLTKIDINKSGQIYSVTTKEVVADIQTLQNWINEIIDYINKEDK